MRTSLVLLLPLAACVGTRSPSFTALGADAKRFVERSAPKASWTGQLTVRMPGIQTLSFEADRPLDDAEVAEFFEGLEFHVVRVLFMDQVRLVSRHDRTIEPATRAISWEYDSCGRRGFVAFYGIRREHGYEVIFNVYEIGVDS
jgi:hypothetical protein